MHVNNPKYVCCDEMFVSMGGHRLGFATQTHRQWPYARLSSLHRRCRRAKFGLLCHFKTLHPYGQELCWCKPGLLRTLRPPALSWLRGKHYIQNCLSHDSSAGKRKLQIIQLASGGVQTKCCWEGRGVQNQGE